METRIIEFDGDNIKAEKVEAVTLSKSRVKAEEAELARKRESLNTRIDAINEEAERQEAAEAALAEKLAIIELAEQKAAEQTISAENA